MTQPKYGDLITVYSVDTSDIEGNPNGGFVALCTTEFQAQQIKKSRGDDQHWFHIGKRNAVICKEEPLSVFLVENINPVEVNVDLPARREEIRRKALEKLSAEERKALGF